MVLKLWWDRAACDSRSRDQPTCDELMTTSYRRQQPSSASAARMDLLQRRPQRVTATLPWHLVQHLQERADFEGRSLSNLIAHLLEASKQ